jgi:hypothetical protein
MVLASRIRIALIVLFIVVTPNNMGIFGPAQDKGYPALHKVTYGKVMSA